MTKGGFENFMLQKNKKTKIKIVRDSSPVKTRVPASSAGRQNDNKAVLVDEVKFAKAEVSYFKGLSIFLITLLVIIFFAFGSLFGLMYLETRYISLQVDDAVSNLTSGAAKSCSCDLCKATDGSLTTNEQVVPTIDLSKWINFEKYGFEVWFPNTWSFLDRPYHNQVHLFIDGKVRETLGDEWGDATISLVKDDVYKDKYEKSVVNIAGTYGFKYEVKKGTNASDVIIVPVAKGYIELHIYKVQGGKTIIAQEIIDTMVGQFKLK
jgi:hypothetical protein